MTEPPAATPQDEIEAIRRLKAQYCRFLDTRDIPAWRALFDPDVVVTLDLAVSTGGADPQTMPPCRASRRSSRWCSAGSPTRPPCTTATRRRST